MKVELTEFKIGNNIFSNFVIIIFTNYYNP